MEMRITVLGGAGKMGCIAVQSLAGDERVDQVILADVNLEQANIVAETIHSPKIKVQKASSAWTRSWINPDFLSSLSSETWKMNDYDIFDSLIQ